MYAKAADMMAWHCLFDTVCYQGASIYDQYVVISYIQPTAKSFAQSLVTRSWYYCIERIQRKNDIRLPLPDYIHILLYLQDTSVFGVAGIQHIDNPKPDGLLAVVMR